VTSTLGIAGNARVLTFWGGNQYDVRYFYPYVVLLGPPTALALGDIVAGRYRGRPLLVGAFGASAAYALFAGWLGVLSMFGPALTSERRILAGIRSTPEGLVLHVPVDIYNAMEVLPAYSVQALLDATFMNRANAWIAVGLMVAGVGGWRIGAARLRNVTRKR
jgi:hypothetical protein